MGGAYETKLRFECILNQLYRFPALAVLCHVHQCCLVSAQTVLTFHQQMKTGLRGLSFIQSGRNERVILSVSESPHRILLTVSSCENTVTEWYRAWVKEEQVDLLWDVLLHRRWNIKA